MALTQVSTGGVKDGTILNADLNASAAIAGTKIADFVTGNTNNRVLTATGTTNSLNGEAALVFDGTRLGVGGTPSGIALDITKNTQAGLRITDSAVTNASYEIRSQTGNSTKLFRIIDVSASADRLVIDSSGNVGIGTTSPSANLESEGNVSSTTQFSGFQGLRIQNANGAAHGVTADINFVAGTGSDNRGAVIGAEFTSAANGNDLYFATNPNSVSNNDTPVERLRITSAGMVTVSGDLTVSSSLAKIVMNDTDGGDSFQIRNDGGVFLIRNSTDGQNALTIDGDGNVTTVKNIRVNISTASDGILGEAYSGYFGLKHADQTINSEYMIISNDTNTYISCSSGSNIYLRPSANSSAHETVFSHDITTYKTDIMMNGHILGRTQHQWGHLQGGYNNIGANDAKSNPIYTIGSNFNPLETTLGNMYGIGFCNQSATFTNSNNTSGWGLYIASDGDARIFLNGGDGRIFASRYNRTQHNSGHLEGGYNNIGSNDAKTNPIYTIGSSYGPAESTLSNMYGIGYSHSNASFTPSGVGWGMYVAANGTSRIYLSGENGNAVINGSLTQNASDIRLKTNIKVIANSIEKIKKIRGITFDWVDDITSKYGFFPSAKHETGVIAQEIQDVISDAVVTAPFNHDYTEKSGVDDNFLTVKHEKIIPLFIEAIKELATKVETLETEVAALKAS